MKTNINLYPDFIRAVKYDSLVYLFGTCMSSALTGKPYSWWQWIADGIRFMKDSALAGSYEESLVKDDSAANMVKLVGKVISATKADGTYEAWMKSSFETNPVTNMKLAGTLKKLLVTQDVFATTNYDMLLEQAAGL